MSDLEELPSPKNKSSKKAKNSNEEKETKSKSGKEGSRQVTFEDCQRYMQENGYLSPKKRKNFDAKDGKSKKHKKSAKQGKDKEGKPQEVATWPVLVNAADKLFDLAEKDE